MGKKSEQDIWSADGQIIIAKKFTFMHFHAAKK